MEKITQTKMTFKAKSYGDANNIQEILSLGFHHLDADEPSTKLTFDDDTESGFYEVDLLFNFNNLSKRRKLEKCVKLIDSFNLLATEKVEEEKKD